MFNTELVLILLNINKIGRKVVNELIKENLPKTLNNLEILSFINRNKILTKKLPLLQIEDIIASKNKTNNIISYCRNNDISIMTILDKDFPQKLRIINDNPVILFYKGNKNCIIDCKSVAIIGTRSPSNYGCKIAKEFANIFAKNKFTIVSGLAKGCDEFAHKGCILQGGKTIAVLPCSLDKIYPASNYDLSNKILSSGGCLVSEYLPGQPLFKNQFIDRDRLQSALSLGVIVIECTDNSGTMHTVDFAIKQNKLVGCYKDKYNTNNNISGNLKILQNKESILIEDASSLNIFISLLNKKYYDNKVNEQSYILHTSNQISFDL